MIPEFTEAGELPDGIHSATTDEFFNRFEYFARSNQRVTLSKKLRTLIGAVKESEFVVRMFVAGSFVTAKAEPNDFDCLLVLSPKILAHTLIPTEYNLASRRMARRIYGGDASTAIDGTPHLVRLLEFFQFNRQRQKIGIVEIIL